MTINTMSNTSIFQNPENFPLEDLKLTVNNDGVLKIIPALDSYWIENRILSLYSPPPLKGNSELGSLDAWKESMQWYINDLKWLLSLEYHKFWSHIVHHSSCMNMLVSFLQEAYPPYLSAHEDSSVMDLYNQAYKKVLIVFSRLITNKEGENKWMNKEYLGQLIYDKFIFTIPIICDLCLIYGTTNKAHITKLLDAVFYLQPKYYNDLDIAISFMKQVFDFVSVKLDNSSTDILPEIFKGFSQNFCGRQSNAINTNNKISFDTLSDFILHILDIAATVKLFLELHSPARKIFKEKEFYLGIVHFYENIITKMYEKVQELSNVENKSTNVIFNNLDNMRVELIDCFRFILSYNIDNILSRSDIQDNVNSYLTVLTDSLSEKTFIADYNTFYPVDIDLDILCQSYEDMDPVKCDFILQAVYANYDEKEITPKKYTVEENVPIINGVDDSQSSTNPIENTNDIPKEAQTQSLISEVRDILPDLGEGFILKCLEHYSFNTERVINCILEGNLDKTLQNLDSQLPIIPIDPLDEQYLKTGIERLNVFDNDEFDIMTRDNVDITKIHKGKKKFQHKNLSEMLNDKTHVKQLKDTYAQYSLVTEDNDLYDDEYDDTYDDGSRDLVAEATTELDRKQIRKSVAFQDTEECQGETDDESDDNDNSKFSGSKSNNPSHFCVNPEELRAKYQARRDLKYGNKNNVERDVVGKAKGQGQDKEVLLNRQKKAQQKSSKSNHNRRSGAQWKRSQGFIPS